MKKHKIIISLAFMIIFQLAFASIVQAAYVNGKYISSAGACLMDYDTGEVLYEYNGNAPRPCASMTKLMNLYCIYEALANGEITLNTVVPISKKVYNLSRNASVQSAQPFNYNVTYTVDEMLGIMVTYSASPAAVALAELIGGSEENFVARMNNQAGRMGIDAYYSDCFGNTLNNVSPLGMVTIARNLIKDYPDVLARTSKYSVNFHGGTYKSTNRLYDKYYYPGADGMKTGTTSAAGYCFLGTASRDGRRMIAVTMSSSSTGQRFVDVSTLLDYGFSTTPTLNTAVGAGIYFTDISTFMDGNEVPTFYYFGSQPKAVIIAEDLMNYGFEISYDYASRTVYANYNKDKAATPVAIDYYKDKSGQKAFDVNNKYETHVVVNNSGKSYEFQNVYNVGGYTCISADEFINLFDCSWDVNKKSLIINTESKEEKNESTIDFTDISVFINDYEVPAFLYDGDTEKAVIVADDLINYGFNVTYNDEEKILCITPNQNKEISPMPIDYYKGKNGQKAFDIATDSNLKVLLDDGENKYYLSDIYNTNGYICISIDELAKYFDYSWNSEDKKAELITFLK